MRPRHRTLSRRQVHSSTTQYPQQHVPLRQSKRKVSSSTLRAVLLIAADDVTSIHAACELLDDLASEETIRQVLYSGLPEFAAL